MAQIDFGAAYRDSTKGATLKALALRKQEAAEAQMQAMQPRQISSMWQGAGQLADVIGGGIREGRAAADEQAGRARFAELLAGGLSPEEMGEAMMLDPETGMKYQEHAWDTEKTADERTYTEGRDLVKHGWDVDAATARLAGEKATQDDQQAAAVDLQNQRLEAERKAAELEATGDTAAAELEHSRARELKILENEAAAKAAGITELNAREKANQEARQPQDELGQAAADFKNGIITEQEYNERKAKINAPPASGVTINTGEIEARKKLAAELGMQPGTPEYTEYVATGDISKPASDRVPVEVMQQVEEADTMVASSQSTIDTLSSILAGPPGQSLNDRAGSGPFAQSQAFGARVDPTGLLFDDEQGKATTELQTKVLTNAYTGLKAIFGGQPTEGERKALDDLQASVNKTPDERRLIIEFAIGLAQQRLAINKRKAEQLRNGTYFEPGGGTSAAPAADGGGGRPVVTNQAEFDALPSGAEYEEDGEVYKKP